MKVSGETLQTLAAFSQINTNAYFQKGKVQYVRSNGRDIVASAELEDDFPIECAFYSAKELLDNLTFSQNPELDFDEDFLKVSYSDLDLFSYYCDKRLVSREGLDSFINEPPETKEIIYSFDFDRTLQSLIQKFVKRVGKENKTVAFIETSEGRVYFRLRKYMKWDTEKKILPEGNLLFSKEIGKSNRAFKAQFETDYLNTLISLDYKLSLDEVWKRDKSGTTPVMFLEAKSRKLKYSFSLTELAEL